MMAASFATGASIDDANKDAFRSTMAHFRLAERVNILRYGHNVEIGLTL